MLARFNKSYVPAYWDDFFNDSFYNGFHTAARSASTPSVNIVENDKEYTIEMAVPGLSRKDFRIDLDGDVLTITSEHKEASDENNRKYMRREFNYNTFKRSFQLPDTVDQNQIKARHDAGILTVQLPKKEEVVQKAPKQIEIK